MPGKSYTLDEVLRGDILELAGFRNLSEEERRKHYQRMLETVMNRVLARVHDSLKPEDRKEFLTMLESGKSEKELLDYLEARGLETNQLMAEETLTYKAEFLKAAGHTVSER